jgi:translation elongation factor EF-G
LTGDDFGEWSDRLRDVEEMVDDPEMRSEAARIRDRAREFRRDFRRHSQEPQWELVEELLAQPLRELKQSVSEELMRRSAEKHAPVPLDRDPVPAEFTDAVQKYYESLGSGR